MNGTARPGTPLSRQERVVIAHLANGCATTREVAEAMGLSPLTVKNTLRRAYIRLEVTGATHGHRHLAIRRATEVGAIRYEFSPHGEGRGIKGRTVPVDAPWQPKTKASPAPAPNVDRLILAGIANGWTDQKIASGMGRSERCVKKRVQQIYATLGAVNRAQAAAEAVLLKLIRKDGTEWVPAPKERNPH